MSRRTFRGQNGEEVTVDIDDGIDSLDAAWAEAVAALPEGWFGPHLYGTRNYSVSDHPYKAEAFKPNPGRSDDPVADGIGPTPAAALRALAAKLREVGR
jgi:hypothetical protein